MKINNKKILAIIASGLLFAALFNDLPYGFFTFLRLAICIIGFYLAYEQHKDNKESLWVWVLGGIAVLFNPIFPIYLERETWVVVDLIVGIIFVLSVFLIKGKK